MNFNSTHSRKSLFHKKRDYHYKSLVNPFFHKDKKRAVVYVNGLLLILILFGLYYFTQHLNIFQIKNINVNGGSPITKNLVIELAQQQQLKKRFFIFSQDKLIFFKSNEYENTLNKQIVLKNLHINKDYIDKTLNISLEERDSLFYLTNQGQFFTLDKDGNLISIISELPATPTIPILEYSERNLMIGSQLADSNYLFSVIDIKELWSKYITGIEINRFLVNDKYTSQLIIITSQGYQIIFDRATDLKEQLNNLNNLLQRLSKEQVTINDYIDMSTNGWLYYK
jgi:cell division septal protein FtsQ